MLFLELLEAFQKGKVREKKEAGRKQARKQTILEPKPGQDAFKQTGLSVIERLVTLSTVSIKENINGRPGLWQ